jgi:hypothetical protein
MRYHFCDCSLSADNPGKNINISLPGALITIWDDPLTVENTSFSKFVCRSLHCPAACSSILVPFFSNLSYLLFPDAQLLTRPGLVIIAFLGSHSAIPKSTTQFFNDATTFSAKKIPTVLIGFSKKSMLWKLLLLWSQDSRPYSCSSYQLLNS